MLHDTKVDDAFVRLVCADYLSKKIEEGADEEEIRCIGTRIGLRMCDDFFLKVDAKKIGSSEDLLLYAKQFFKVYFGYEPRINDQTVSVEGFILQDRPSLVMICGILEHILSYLTEGHLKINLEEEKVYRILLTRKDSG